jgi:tRNA A-37 threonylcarbamoyl transferase component Bud32
MSEVETAVGADLAVQQDWMQMLPVLLETAGIVDKVAAVVPLAGGVSSDIVAVRLASGRTVCAKRALGQLKVAAEWQAPIERNHYEVAWLREAARIVPGAVPRVLAEDKERGVVLLEYLPAERYGLWKAQLLDGHLDARVAPRLGSMLGAIHGATWERTDIAARFATDRIFDALRLDPYLRTLAQRTPDLAGPILAALERTAGTHLALVHGDVSPKNIFVDRQDGHPVLLDAECAWYGDPAFDAAFLVNHLLLKAVHVPPLRPGLIAAAEVFFANWRDGLPQPARDAAEARTAVLVGCLMLARVDGKSPVEYLDQQERARVRAMARGLVAEPPAGLGALLDRVGGELAAAGREAR